jgi:hypothetical protein
MTKFWTDNSLHQRIHRQLWLRVSLPMFAIVYCFGIATEDVVGGCDHDVEVAGARQEDRAAEGRCVGRSVPGEVLAVRDGARAGAEDAEAALGSAFLVRRRTTVMGGAARRCPTREYPRNRERYVTLCRSVN